MQQFWHPAEKHSIVQCIMRVAGGLLILAALFTIFGCGNVYVKQLEATEFFGGGSLAAVTDARVRRGDGFLDVLWTDPQEEDFAGVAISWEPGGAEPTPVPPGFEAFSITGLENGLTYVITLIAFDREGNLSEPVNLQGVPGPSVPISVGPASLQVTEGSGNTAYEVVLTEEPNTDVFVDVLPETGLAASSSVLVFSPVNWNQPQSVSVSAQDNTAVEGTRTLSLVHESRSDDPLFSTTDVASVAVEVLDNDPGLLSLPENLAVTENAVGIRADLTLSMEPDADVTVSLSPGTQLDLGSGPGTPVSLVFTANNWDVSQSISIDAVDDQLYEASHTGVITRVFSSAGTVYGSVPDGQLNVSITDDEQQLSIYITSQNTLYRFDDMGLSGELSYAGGAGGGANFSNIEGVYADSTGIYVGDWGAQFIFRIDDMAGTNQQQYGTFAGLPGIYRYNSQLYFSSVTLLYRSDDMAGTGEISYDGTAGNAFQAPQRPYVDSTGIYVTDSLNARVYRFDDMAGAGQVEYDATSTGEPFQEPTEVLRDSQGRIYVLDPVGAKVYRIDDMGGANQVTYDGSILTAFTNPLGIAIDSLDRIYVVNQDTPSTLYRFDDMNGTNQIETTLPTAIAPRDIFVVGP